MRNKIKAVKYGRTCSVRSHKMWLCISLTFRRPRAVYVPKSCGSKDPVCKS